MTQDAMVHLSVPYQDLLVPVIKVNKLSAANLETLVSFQMNALQAYVDLAIGRMKAAAEISDPASLQAFLNSQAKSLTLLQQQFVEDAKALGELMAHFKAEFEQMARESSLAKR